MEIPSNYKFTRCLSSCFLLDKKNAMIKTAAKLCIASKGPKPGSEAKMMMHMGARPAPARKCDYFWSGFSRQEKGGGKKA